MSRCTYCGWCPDPSHPTHESLEHPAPREAYETPTLTYLGNLNTDPALRERLAGAGRPRPIRDPGGSRSLLVILSFMAGFLLSPHVMRAAETDKAPLGALAGKPAASAVPPAACVCPIEWANYSDFLVGA